MRVAQTIVKMADKSGARKDPDGPEIRMVAMLSRPMQKAAHGDEFFISSVIRPIVEFRRSSSESQWELYTADDEARKTDENNLTNFLNFGPFKTVDRMMNAFDNLSQGGKLNTHLILCDVIDALDLEKSEHDIAFTDCEINKSWRSKFSLRHYIALTYYQRRAVQVTLLGQVVQSVDFSPENAMWKNSIVALQPGETTTVNNKKVTNTTRFGVQIGFVFDAQEVALVRKQNTAYAEHSHKTNPESDSPYQGVMLLSRKRVMQMPKPVETDRSGKLLDKFAKGVGALLIAECPDDYKGDPAKTRFEVGGAYDHEKAPLMELFAKVCSLLHQENTKKKPPRLPLVSHSATSAVPADPSSIAVTSESERASSRTPRTALAPSEAKNFKVGDRVEAFYKGEDWYPGKIIKVNGDGSFNIQYDDGDKEESVFPGYINRPMSNAVLPRLSQPKVLKKQGTKRKRGSSRADAEASPSYPAADDRSTADLQAEFSRVQHDYFFGAEEAKMIAVGTEVAVASLEGEWGNALVIRINKESVSIKWRDFPAEKKVEVKFSDALQRLSKCSKCEQAHSYAVELQQIEATIMERQKAPAMTAGAVVPTEDGEGRCPICMETPHTPHEMACCGVQMCLGCYDELRSQGGHGVTGGQRRCPNCRMNLPSLRGRQPRTSQVEASQEAMVVRSAGDTTNVPQSATAKQLQARLKTEKKLRADDVRHSNQEKVRLQNELAETTASLEQKTRDNDEIVRENNKLKEKVATFLDQFEPEIHRLTEENEQLKQALNQQQMASQ